MLKEEEKDYVQIKIVKHEKNEFSKKVMDLAKETNSSHLDAILEMVENRKIEIEIVSKLITPELKEILEKEARINKLIKE